MASPYHYETQVEWTRAREGILQVEGLPALEFASPAEFQGRDDRWTPEHLYVGAAEACLLTTLLAIAELSKLEIAAYRSHARGKLEKVEGVGYLITEIVLQPKVQVRREADVERARRLLEKAEKNCLVSKSVRTTIRVEPQISVSA